MFYPMNWYAGLLPEPRIKDAKDTVDVSSIAQLRKTPHTSFGTIRRNSGGLRTQAAFNASIKHLPEGDIADPNSVAQPPADQPVVPQGRRETVSKGTIFEGTTGLPRSVGIFRPTLAKTQAAAAAAALATQQAAAANAAALAAAQAAATAAAAALAAGIVHVSVSGLGQSAAYLIITTGGTGGSQNGPTSKAGTITVNITAGGGETLTGNPYSIAFASGDTLQQVATKVVTALNGEQDATAAFTLEATTDGTGVITLHDTRNDPLTAVTAVPAQP